MDQLASNWTAYSIWACLQELGRIGAGTSGCISITEDSMVGLFTGKPSHCSIETRVEKNVKSPDSWATLNCLRTSAGRFRSVDMVMVLEMM